MNVQLPIPPDVPQKLRDSNMKFNLILYKTQLCNIFEESGKCNFKSECLYAHGKRELRTVPRHPKYKTELCRSYHSNGACPYGTKCRFIHNFEEAVSNDWKRWTGQLDEFRRRKLIDPSKYYTTGPNRAPHPHRTAATQVPREAPHDSRLSIFTDLCTVE